MDATLVLGRGLHPRGTGTLAGAEAGSTLPEASTSGESLQADPDLEAQRRTIRRAMWIGLCVWPSFTLLDVYMCWTLYPGAPLGLLIACRLGVEAVLYGVYRATRNPAVTVERLVVLQHAAFGLAALGISLMAVHLGGLRSAYMHGISLVCLVHAAVIPAPWRRSLKIFLPIGLVFPVVLGLTALLSPAERAEWFSLASLQVFASHYVFVVASSFVGMVSGHAVWAAQQQVYHARRLGRYRLQAPLGTGGMGEVWLAWDGSLRRNVALKLLRVNGSSPRDLVRRFEREARAASRLSGPHTVHIYDFGGSDDGLYYIAMEYLVGTDLFSLVHQEGPLSPARAWRLALQACASLEEAHAAGIIHRDIKPQNLFITRVGRESESLRLLDFGIARFQAPDSEGEPTHAEVLMGTPAFMAPELWQGRPGDARTDIYALGATLYFALAGAPPFEGEQPGDIRRGHVEKDPGPIALRRGTPVPASLESVVRRCLEKSPERRFQSVRELQAALAARPAAAT